jgi:hypothetical protein
LAPRGRHGVSDLIPRKEFDRTPFAALQAAQVPERKEIINLLSVLEGQILDLSVNFERLLTSGVSASGKERKMGDGSSPNVSS